jgi:hypothetical protein
VVASYGFSYFNAGTFLNNLIYITSPGWWASAFYSSTGTYPADIRNNGFVNVTNAFYGGSSIGCTNPNAGGAAGMRCSIAEFESITGSTGNQGFTSSTTFTSLNGTDTDIETYTDNDWTLSGTAPGNLFTMGLDLTADGITSDFYGATRTGAAGIGYSVGATEQ